MANLIYLLYVNYCVIVSWEDVFIKQMTIEKERQAQKKLHTDKGWYSKADMIQELKWSPSIPQLLQQKAHC